MLCGNVGFERPAIAFLRPQTPASTAQFSNIRSAKQNTPEGTPLRNRTKLSLRVPVPKHRPGDTPDFSGLPISEAGEVRRPEIDAPPREISDLAFSLVRVLDKSGKAVGPWNPKLDPDTLRRGLKV